MKIECKLTFVYRNRMEAAKALQAVELDNEGFVEAKLVDNRIVSKVKAKNLSSLRHTLDDYLACVAIAEKLISQS